MAKQSTPHSQVETLSPHAVLVTIRERESVEERTYSQSELSLRATGTLVEFLASLVADPSAGFDLDELLATDLSSSAGVATLLGRITSLGPTVVAAVLAIILGAPDDADWIADNISPAGAIRILTTFVGQNDVPGLVRDFTSLQSELRVVMKQFATETEVR